MEHNPLSAATAEFLFENVNLVTPICIFSEYTNPQRINTTQLLAASSRAITDNLDQHRAIGLYMDTKKIVTTNITNSSDLVKTPNLLPKDLNVTAIPLMFLDLGSYLLDSPEIDKTVISYKRFVKSVIGTIRFKNYNCVCFIDTLKMSLKDIATTKAFAEITPSAHYLTE